MIHFDITIEIIASFNLIGLPQGRKPIRFPETLTWRVTLPANKEIRYQLRDIHQFPYFPT